MVFVLFRVYVAWIKFFFFCFLFCGIVSVHFDLIKILLAMCGNYNHKHLIYLVHSFDSIWINLYSHHPSVIIIRHRYHHRWIVGLLILALFNSIKKINFCLPYNYSFKKRFLSTNSHEHYSNNIHSLIISLNIIIIKRLKIKR